MKEDKRLFIEKLKFLRFFIMIVLIVGLAVFLRMQYQKSSQPKLTTSFLNGKLESVSDLTTSELIYTGLIKYSEGKIPFLTKNSFSMIYTATIRAGIDLSQAQIKLTDEKVTVFLPACEVQSIEVDADSIEFYDEHWALFNWTQKEDVIDTISTAKEDVKQKADIDSLLENAKKQTTTIINGLFVDIISERKLEFAFN